MGRIQILPEELINQIAAGEVVERPASVVKELVENSLDAGATQIELEIRQGGRKLIRVHDNGTGMEREEARLAFSRHATSKISVWDDLHRLNTLGFRGEALPSIASVSRLELVTKSEPEATGTLLQIEAGEIKAVRDSAANTGTTVQVSDLFYSTPARRKFLKSENAENRNIIELVTGIALAFPAVGMRLTVDGREVLNLAASSKLAERVSQIYGREMFQKLIWLGEETSGIKISGFLGQPQLSKSTRTDLKFFVNRRSISSRLLWHALIAAYGEMLIKGKFPVAILFLEVPPSMVDVNVHPQKTEVRFWDERQLHDVVFRSVKKALDRNFRSALEQAQAEKPAYTAGNTSGRVRENSPSYRTGNSQDRLKFGSPRSQTEILQATDFSRLSDPLTQKSLLQVFNTYILSTGETELLILDQHAAHEKVLYEDFLKSIQLQKKTPSQKLLFPETVELTPPEHNIFEPFSKLLEELGFDVQPLSGRTVVVAGLPAVAKNAKVGLLRQVLGDLLEESKAGKDSAGSLAASLACRAAVKAGDALTGAEMEQLLKSLLTLDRPQTCPHGRPTLIRIPITELNRRFGRS
ncbi:MAG: DNA mismatch repair endonuclease MutL [candidate division Zixibacteria bacterium]|nr:DNA mismatch repair endonuclease MutL [candidate division Zixibacteria bacterium]